MTLLNCRLRLIHWVIGLRLGSYITVSVEKCFALNIRNVVIQPRISISGILLPTVLSCRDLRITVLLDLSKLSPSTAHISGITVKAHQRANLIFRSFVSRDVSLLLRAYLTYVRPLVECNSVVWSQTGDWNCRASHNISVQLVCVTLYFIIICKLFYVAYACRPTPDV